jgi:hypothetical protein
MTIKIYLVIMLREKYDPLILWGNYSENWKQKKNLFISRIQSNHDKEFENTNFSSYCDEHDVHQEFCTLITSQQNGIVERKNRYTEEMARTMLNSKKVALYF